MPKPFDVEYAGKKHAITYMESMNTVLLQEILRYNKLLILVRSSLVNIGKAIKGEVVMSQALEKISDSIFDNRIPDGWKKSSYPSLKPLASYIVDLAVRLDFINTWIEKGIPPNYWISGFFFTQSFLTGIKQNYARRYVIAIDQIELDFEVFSNSGNLNKDIAPKDGAYVHGLYLEGARWDADVGVLTESAPKILFTLMPYIWLKPADKKDIKFPHHYTCPIYKTLDRRGTLSTTGHSTNFVCMIELSMQKKHTARHWVKRGVALITQLND